MMTRGHYRSNRRAQVGKMIAPMVHEASKEVPESCAKLKKRLEND